MSERAARGPRGRLWIQAVAFGLVLVAAYLQFRGNLESSLRLVWASIAVSAVALVAAVLSVLVPGKRTTSKDPDRADRRPARSPADDE